LRNTKDKIYFNFSYRALKLLGDGLYSNPWTAISELVANGIDAEATKIYIHINMVDKESSTIEIFDNGYGMNYNDLAERYALIGKNKRTDANLNAVQKNKVMGRKGIGKLAALYLSSKYYLISKVNNTINCWSVDMTNVADDDIPNMKRENTIQIESTKEWSKCSTGTLIKLVDVDLRNIGEQTLDGLKAKIADYYSFEKDTITIFVSFRQKEKEKILFEIVEKQIAFKNFYAFYNNTDIDFTGKLKKNVLLSTNVPTEIEGPREKSFYKKYPKRLIKKEKFNTTGESHFIQEDGKLSEKLFHYEMCGWIGIHATIEKAEAKDNDDLFLRNKAYQPNRLRLYVRNKLAIENFMDYLGNTQAFGKYIEGEIHFDILDANNLPDIATANRQAYKENNDRIQKLVVILKPIVSALIKERIEIGSLIRKEEEKYWKAKEAEERKKAEQEARRAEEASQKARKAEEARQEAEKKYHHAENLRQMYENEVNVRKKQIYFLEGALNVDERTSAYNTHVIKGNAEDIAMNLESILKKHPELKEEYEFQSIAYAINKIIMTVRNFAIINYDFERVLENDDLGYFIEQYFKSIAVEDDIKIEINNTSSSYIRFPYQDITMMLYNIVSNSKKAKATELKVEIYNKNDNLVLKFIDNGLGIKNDINIYNLFELGLSYTHGTGIGLAQIKDLVENKLNGTVTIERNETKGITLKIEVPNENKI